MEKNGYLDKYGGSVVVTGITLFIFFLIVSYFLYTNENRTYKT